MTTEEFNLENYEPKGELEGFPKEIIARMLECQEEQGNERNVTVFEKQIEAGTDIKGFFWDDTKEKFEFWKQVIRDKDFNLFFGRYPKKDNQDNSQEFRIGDKVIDIITRQIGFVKNINIEEVAVYQLAVTFEDCTTKFYSLEGKYYNDSKVPILLHYRDDYDYSIIDFNNLPKRQEHKRWRAKEGCTYYSFTFDFKVASFYDTKRSLDNKAYDSGNYFKTKDETQEVADKLNKYFQELINPNKELWQKN